MKDLFDDPILMKVTTRTSSEIVDYLLNIGNKGEFDLTRQTLLEYLDEGDIYKWLSVHLAVEVTSLKFALLYASLDGSEKLPWGKLMTILTLTSMEKYTPMQKDSILTLLKTKYSSCKGIEMWMDCYKS